MGKLTEVPSKKGRKRYSHLPQREEEEGGGLKRKRGSGAGNALERLKRH